MFITDLNANIRANPPVEHWLCGNFHPGLASLTLLFTQECILKYSVTYCNRWFM